MITHVTSTAQYDELISRGEVLVDFFATWCGPCNMLSPVIEKVATAHPEVSVLKVDVDQLPELARRYGVQSIPTLLLIKDGKLEDKTLGFMPEPKLLAFLGK
ncbi:MAG: thioredoxin [Bacilli bacterium]|nr:thioredoxin [Bacilli bacterium]